MPNRVAGLRAEILTVWPDAVMRHRGEAGFSMLRPDGLEEHRYGTGPWHWRQSDAHEWSEIDTDIEDHPGWAGHVRSARFDTLLTGDGTRRFVPRRWLPDEWVEFGALQWQTGGGWRNVTLGDHSRQGNRHRWVRPSHDYEIGFTGRGCRTNLTLKSAAVARPLRWPVTLHGLTWKDGTLISESDGEQVGFIRPPTWTDASESPETRPILWTFDGTHVTLTPDLTDAVFPVVVDPDYAIAAGADDGYVSPPSTFDSTSTAASAGNYNGTLYHAWLRFAAIAAVQAQTCLAATITVKAATSVGGTCNLKIRAVDEDDHAAPTSYAEWNTDHGIHTTAAVDWDPAAWTAGTGYTTPDFATVVQEILDRINWQTGYDIGIHADDDGSPSGATNYRQPATWNHLTYTEPILSLTLETVTNDQASPACLTLTSEWSALTTGAGSAASPAALSLISEWPALAYGQGQSASPVALTLTSEWPALTTAAGSAVSPVLAELASEWPALTIGAGSAVSPGLLSLTVEQPACTTGAGSAASPSLLDLTSEWSALTYGQGQAASPSVLEIISEWAQPTAHSGASAKPACATLPTDWPALTYGQGQSASPAALSLSVEFPAGTTGQGQSASPSLLDLASEWPALSTGAGSSASPSLLDLTSDWPVCSPCAGSSTSPTLLDISSEWPQPTAHAGWEATPSLLNLTSEWPACTTGAGTAVSPALLELLAEWPQATPHAGWAVDTALLDLASDWPTLTYGQGQSVSPSLLTITSDWPACTTGAGSSASPAALTLTSEWPAEVARMRLQRQTVITGTRRPVSITSSETTHLDSDED